MKLATLKNGGVGYCCMAELRMVETIEMFDQAGASIFGAIDQPVASYEGRQP